VGVKGVAVKTSVDLKLKVEIEHGSTASQYDVFKALSVAVAHMAGLEIKLEDDSKENLFYVDVLEQHVKFKSGAKP